MNLIIGKNGFIAKKLNEISLFSNTSSNKNEDGCIYLNLLEVDRFDYSILNSNVTIIFLAAISSPDECNNNYENTYNINVTGTKKFIEKALKRGSRVLFFSSDVVYGNRIEEVDENSMMNPFGNYANMKYEIEKYFEGNKNFKVFRLSYILSKEDKYLSYLSRCINSNEVAEVFHPFSRKVVYIKDLLDAIQNIIVDWEKFDNQKFNICGEEYISRKDIADLYNEVIDDPLKYSLIKPDTNFWEARPKDINIKSIYLERLLGRKPIKIEKAIEKIYKEGK